MTNLVLLIANLAFAYLCDSVWIGGCNLFVAGMCFMGLVDDICNGAFQ